MQVESDNAAAGSQGSGHSLKEAPLPLFDLPLDMLRLIVAELPPQDLGQFARVSRAARALAEARCLSVGYLHELFRALSAAEPPGPLPDLFRDAHWLGYAVWYREDAGSDRGRGAARLLRWLATFEPQEGGVARRVSPRQYVLALVAPRFEQALGGLVAGWALGEELARKCKEFAYECQLFAEPGPGRAGYARKEGYQCGPVYRKLLGLAFSMSTNFKSEELTAEQFGILYCAWLHCLRRYRDGPGQGFASHHDTLLIHLEGGVSQRGGLRSARSTGLIFYTEAAPRTQPDSYIRVTPPI